MIERGTTKRNVAMWQRSVIDVDEECDSIKLNSFWDNSKVGSIKDEGWTGNDHKRDAYNDA